MNQEKNIQKNQQVFAIADFTHANHHLKFLVIMHLVISQGIARLIWMQMTKPKVTASVLESTLKSAQRSGLLDW